MFSGLTLAESQMASAPASHGLRRVVMISDGIANVGPSSPEVLGSLAQNGLRFRAQVTSFGVGNDYDERTLNALSVRTNGRLYHIGEPREMAGILRNEVALLDATLASDASVEIVPAPGVQVLGADGFRAEFRDGGMRIPLGALHAGQHREALVRVRIVDPAAFEGHSRSLASVRLRFRDAAEGDLERIQEVVARTQLSPDENAVAQSVNSRTKAIVAIMDASKTQMAAAQRINDGNFVDADKELERAQQTLAAAGARRHGACREEAPRGRGIEGRDRAGRDASDALEAEGRPARRRARDERERDARPGLLVAAGGLMVSEDERRRELEAAETRSDAEVSRLDPDLYPRRMLGNRRSGDSLRGALPLRSVRLASIRTALASRPSGPDGGSRGREMQPPGTGEVNFAQGIAASAIPEHPGRVQ